MADYVGKQGEGKMAIVDQSGIVGKIRDKPIGQRLEQLLKSAAEATGIDVVYVTSGSQPGTTGQSTGSSRHNNGRAADLQLRKDGATLRFTDADGGEVAAFVTACAQRGATGIGAGVGYMGNRTIHVGFGTSANDTSKIVWGAGGASANAPQWLRNAANAGWANPVTPAVAAGDNAGVATFAAMSPVLGDFVVAARGGLQLRKGPGSISASPARSRQEPRFSSSLWMARAAPGLGWTCRAMVWSTAMCWPPSLSRPTRWKRWMNRVPQKHDLRPPTQAIVRRSGKLTTLING